MRFGQLAEIERGLVTRNMIMNPQQYRRKPGILSPSTVVISGYGGQLYIADGGNQWERQLTGEVRLTADAAQKWSDFLETQAAQARDAQIRLVHLVAPEKQVALPAFRWKTDLGPDISDRPIKHLMAGHAGATIIYPAADFQKHQPESELYWRGNSHWCASGCLIAASSVVRALLDDDLLKTDLVPFEHACIQHDLTAHFSDDESFEEVIRIRPSGSRIFDNLAFVKTGHYTGSHYIIRNPDAPVKESLVLFGDSYACDLGLAAALSACFFDVHFVWAKTIAWAYVQRVQARFVVWESAERFLIKPPAFD